MLKNRFFAGKKKTWKRLIFQWKKKILFLIPAEKMLKNCFFLSKKKQPKNTDFQWKKLIPAHNI